MTTEADFTIHDHARAIRQAIVGMEKASQMIAELKRQLDRIERRARIGVEGKNAQERDDAVAEKLERDMDYLNTLQLIDDHRLVRAELEADIAYHRLLAASMLQTAQLVGAVT